MNKTKEFLEKLTELSKEYDMYFEDEGCGCCGGMELQNSIGITIIRPMFYEGKYIDLNNKEENVK